jgi:hypothetical protein
MWVRIALVCACMLGIGSAFAQELSPEQARAFIAGKLFQYNCFDGTTGVGRIYPDGSVIGTIRPSGSRVVRFAALPPGTIRVTPTSVCAHLPGLPIHPCFRVQKTDYRSFRGSLWGLGFAYCDFREPHPRSAMIRREPRRAPPNAVAAARHAP